MGVLASLSGRYPPSPCVLQVDEVWESNCKQGIRNWIGHTVANRVKIPRIRWALSDNATPS
ncbi:hypothetical protein HPP92_029144, partial [Vanilla planifolia]